MNPPAAAVWGITAQAGSIVNFYAGEVLYEGVTDVAASASVTVYGTELVESENTPSANLTTVTGYYENDAPIYLIFALAEGATVTLAAPGAPPPENTPPVAAAGPDIVVSTKDIASTIIEGTATDPDTEDSLTYRWLEGTVEFTLWQPVGDGEATLDLATIEAQYLGIGIHTLTLEVTDGKVTVFDEMDLTIENTPPVADAGPDTAVLTKNMASMIIEGTATDYDTEDLLQYRWLKGTVEWGESASVGENGDAPLNLGTVPPEYLTKGTHILTLEVSDGQEIDSDEMILTIEVQQIQIDIKPGSDNNVINLGSNGVVPVAILSTADFDATALDPDSIFLAGAGVRVRGKRNKYLASEEDVNGDGLVDLKVKIETQNLDPGTFQDGTAILQVKDGETVIYEGSDEITIVPPH